MAQKRHIGADVAVAQSVGELDAVEDPDPVVEAEDVLGLLRSPCPSHTRPEVIRASSSGFRPSIQRATSDSNLRLVVIIENGPNERIGRRHSGRRNP